MRELDENSVVLDQELPKGALEILTSLRRRKVRITTWLDAYSSQLPIWPENTKSYTTLRRQVMMVVHNGVKLARRTLHNSGIDQAAATH